MYQMYRTLFNRSIMGTMVHNRTPCWLHLVCALLVFLTISAGQVKSQATLNQPETTHHHKHHKYHQDQPTDRHAGPEGDGLLGTTQWGAGINHLELQEGAYDGLVVEITDEVSQDDCNYITRGIQSVLRELSSQMWSATEGRASLRQVTVALPRSWLTNSLTCSHLTPVTTSSAHTEGHIRVTTAHPVFDSRPWTQQSQGCGRPGDFIQMGGDLLRSSNNESYVHTARLLLAEWAKFRWGVFDERGHTNDPLYPPTFRDPNTHQWVATSCADGVVKGTTCDPSQPGCVFIPEPYSNNHLSSSLLSLPELRTVRQFCDDKTHNRVAPTKHNALCGGRSAWEIIQQTQDFMNNRNMASSSSRGLEPLIRFVQQASPRYVFVIEDTTTMNLQRRWEFLRKALRRVIYYDIPDGSHVGVVTFESVARTVAPLSYLDDKDMEQRQKTGSSMPRNPSTVPESQKCILCGLQEAERLLATDPNGADGATIIFITTGSGQTTERELKEIIWKVKQKNLKIEVVLYPLSERRGAMATTHGLEALVEATHGSLFTVMDEGVGNDSKVKMMVALMDALLAAIYHSAPRNTPGSTVLVHNAAYPGSITSMSSGSFALDDSLESNARFSIYYYNLNHVGNAIKLTTPSGKMISSVNMQEEDGDVNMIYINLENAERGLWTYSVENRADSHQGLYVQITAKHNSSTGLMVRLWTSTSSRSINTSDPSSPVVIYAEVKNGVAPIMNARVVAKLQRLGTNDTGSNYQPVYLDLWDNGIGDPDITKGDGIYSRYLPPLNGHSGRYLLSADVDYNGGLAVVAKGPPSHHQKLKSLHYYQQGYESRISEQACCGSFVPHMHTRRAAPFVRHVALGVLEIHSPMPYRDTTPPSRVLDLRVEVNDTIQQIVLRWTAPGDDWDVGRAQGYETVIAPMWREARAFQGDYLTGLPTPLSAGTLHVTNLHFIRYEELWYISMRAVDEAGNVGGLGNIAALWVPRPPTTYEITTRTHPALTTSGNYTMPSELGSGLPVGLSELQLEDVVMILGSLGGFLLVVVSLVAYCYCITTRRHKHQNQKDVEKIAVSGGSNIMVKSGSLIGDDGGDGCGSQESLHRVVKCAPETGRDGQPLSPVQSWGATTLLQEHERRLSVHSGTPEDTLTSYQNDAAPLHTPFPDVTITNNLPIPDSGTVPMFLPCTHEEVPCPCAIPGPDYTSYSSAWDEPLTGHLLTHAGQGALPLQPPPIPQQAIPHLVDQKRRNVTQV